MVGLIVDIGMGILLPTDDGGSGLGTVSATSGFPTPRLTMGTLPLVVGRTRIVSMDVVELVRCLCTRSVVLSRSSTPTSYEMKLVSSNARFRREVRAWPAGWGWASCVCVWWMRVERAFVKSFESKDEKCEM